MPQVERDHPRENRESPGAKKTRHPPDGLRWLMVGAWVYLLLVGVSAVGGGFKWVSGGDEGARAIFAFATNPIVGVILGTLATALVQSSSTVSAVIVGLVAGGVPVAVAVPMIMGANMGTTITNTIVSLGNFKDRPAFGRAFESSTVHDFFNLYAILIFLPIEVMLRPLERTAAALANFLLGDYDASIKDFNLGGGATKPVADMLQEGLGVLPDKLGAICMILIGVGLILLSVVKLGQLLRQVMSGPAQRLVEVAIGRGPIRGIFSGTLITLLVQSSSTTTSLVVPLAAAGVLSIRQVFHFTLGANIGTCITAVLAATAVAPAGARIAMEIALVHLLFNTFGVTLFMLVRFLHDLPIRSAEFIGRQTRKNRGWAFIYLGGVFFGLPSLVLLTQYLFVA